MNLLAIMWDMSPEIFSFWGITIRWYGVLFALGFMTGQHIIYSIWKQEGKSQEDLDYLLLCMVISVVLGARLGHCLFYQPEHYLAHPLEILKVWEGGLASHGTTFGILAGIWIYTHYTMDFSPFSIRQQKREGQSFLYILDRIVLTVALGGAFIRLGNLMNSEIVGKPTDLPWGFIFLKNGENFARHPSQLYESISCIFLFLFLYWLYNRTKEKTPEGRIVGAFLIILFTLRFFYEYLKKNQVEFEEGMILNMGQLLSIPQILLGVAFLWYSTRQKKTNI
jgi:phosphatidylglycerol:prolipoprotein diacylglycerol transferase